MKDLETVFEYRDGGKRYWYDAWAWLQWLCAVHPNPISHPVFRVPLSVWHRTEIYRACRADYSVPTFYGRMEAIELCEKKGKQTRVHHDVDGAPSYIVWSSSPLYTVVPDFQDAVTTGDDLVETGFLCSMRVKYDLIDCDNIVVQSFVDYV